MKLNKRILYVTILIMAVLIGSFFLSKHNKKLKEDEFIFKSLEWQDKKEVCQQCKGNTRCIGQMKLTALAPNIEEKLSKNNIEALHCLLIIDGKDQFKEKGSYFTITQENFETWHEEDIREQHEVVFCCGAGDITKFNERFKKGFKFYQVCHTKTLKALCD